MRIGVLFSLLLFVHITYAQQYFYSRYTPKNGLVNNRARSIFQDSKGRLYICTYGGLSVYDGSRFSNYTTEDGLITSLVNDIVEMGEDSLWVIPNGGAIHCLVHGILKNIKTSDGFYPVINQLFHASDSAYYALSDEGFYRLEGRHFVKIPLYNSTGKEVGINILKGAEWHRQLFLICQPYAFGQFRFPSLIIYNLDTHRCIVAPNRIVYYFPVLTPGGDLLLGTSDGVLKVDQKALENDSLHLLPPPAPYEDTKNLISGHLYFDRTDGLWLVTTGKVIRIAPDGSKQFFTEASGLPPGEIHAILQDREKNIWFSNDQNGIVKLASPQVQFYTQPTPGFTVTDISARDNSDSVWFFDGIKKNLLLMTGEVKKLYHGIGPFPSGDRIFMGSKAYLVGPKEIYALHFLTGQRFNATLLHQDTTVIDGYGSFDHTNNIILTANKLNFLVDGKVEQYPLSFYADQAAVDKYNRVWVLTRSRELIVYRINNSGASPSLQLLKRYPLYLPNVSPRSLTIDGEGRVWMGTRDQGLYCLFFDDLRLTSMRQITMADGLSENFVNYLYTDADNSIWACTPTGLNKIRYTEGHFTVENITPSNDIYQRIMKVLASAPGTHWAVTSEGFMKIGPSGAEPSTYIPKVLFSKVLVGDAPISDLTGKKLILPYDKNTLSFYIGTPTFVDEGGTRYTYLLEGGHDPKWSTPSIQSAINFVNLPPGNYVLRVKAFFPTGRYPEQTAAYSFVIHPPWWQTWWFRSLLVLALTAIIMLAIRGYIRRKLEMQRIALEKKQAIEKERTRIATDMHDDLGAGLSRIKFLSETIGIKKQQQLPIEEEITSIRAYSHEMIDKMGEIVWALNQKNDSLSDLLSYTRSYAVEYLMQEGIRCTVEVPESFPELFVSGEFRRNVYLTMKETLHNIVKHARARRVWLRMDTGRELTITIQDDGVGFDRGRVRPFSNGLANMQKRIRDIGGQLSIQPGREAGVEMGTVIKIIVPL